MQQTVRDNISDNTTTKPKPTEPGRKLPRVVFTAVANRISPPPKDLSSLSAHTNHPQFAAPFDGYYGTKMRLRPRGQVSMHGIRKLPIVK